ncbi:MAG: DUF3842 family protein [Caulobacteraceae bacterium]
MRIAVIDGQGGGIGKTIVEKLRKELPENTDIIALGTNALATAAMMKSGANEGASGENAIIYNANKVDIIVGTIGIIIANSMLGELTPSISKAIAESSAKKILIPLNKCNVEVVGAVNEPLPHMVDKTIEVLKKYL